MLFIILQIKPTGRCPTAEAVPPGKPPILPIEKPTPTPTVTTPTPAVTTVTVTSTVTVERTVERVLTHTVTTVSPTTIAVTEWGTTAAIAIILLIVGFVAGYFMRRK